MTNFDERANDWVSHPKKVEHACVVAEATIGDTDPPPPFFADSSASKIRNRGKMTVSKDHAGIKIPAPTLTIIHIIVAILLGWLAPLSIPAPIFVKWLGLGLAALGFVLGVLALIEFKRARTTSNPKKPTQSFVTSGIYRYTRNPIYLGFVLILIGLPINMGNYWGIVLVWPLITFTNNMVIKHEEAYLEKKFKEQYAGYRSRVRRWL